jgi:hypothetical protein
MNNFCIDQNNVSLENTMHFCENSCKNRIIEYIFISEGACYNKEFPVSFHCFVPLQIIKSDETHACLLKDCATGKRKLNFAAFS